MADYNSSLPIRTEIDGDVVVKISDGVEAVSVTADNRLEVQDQNVADTLTDGTAKTQITDGADVASVNGNAELNVHDTEANAELDAITTQVTNLNTATTDGTQKTQIVDGDGDVLAVAADGSIPVTFAAGTKVTITDGTEDAAVTANNELTVFDTEANAALDNIESDAAIINSNTSQISANQVNGTQITKVSDGTDTLAVNTDGSINVVVQNAVSGGDVHEHGQGVIVAPNTPVNIIDITVPSAKSFQIKAVQVASSGKSKAQLKTGASGSEVVRATLFISTASGLAEVVFPQPIEVAELDKILLEVTNTDKQNQDIYGFINGEKVSV